MRKLSMLFVLLLGYSVCFAQDYCNNPHRIFKVPSGKTPKVITKLGTAPQFTTLRHLSSARDVYNKIKALGSNAKYRNEMNSLLTSLGYSSINDPSFDASDIKAAEIPFGAMGMLGETGNTYQYAMIAVPNKTSVHAWRIMPANGGCPLYVMSDCGNAFYHSNPAMVLEQEKVVVKEYVNAGPARVKLNVYARYRDKDCEWCSNCDLPDANNIREEKVLLTQEEIDEIPVDTNEYPVKNIYIDVDKKTMKRIRYAPSDDDNGWMPDEYARVR